MALKTKRFNVADYLHTERDRFGFLLACLEEAPDDHVFFRGCVRDVARSRAKRPVTRNGGLTFAMLSKTIAARGNPGIAAVLKVTRALGYRMNFEKLASKPSKKKHK